MLRFQVKMDCPEGADCKELVDKKMDMIRSEGVEVNIAHLPEPHKEL